MTIAQATELVNKAVTRMNEAYGRPVFDEWAIVDLTTIQGQIFEYSGPRHAEFLKDFLENLVPLRQEMLKDDLEPGDFSFVRDARGADFDAFIVLGENLYLLCNHTVKDMEDITRDPQWKLAQASFVSLSERFRMTPVQI